MLGDMVKKEKAPRKVVYAVVSGELLASLDRFAKSRTWSRGTAVRHLLGEALTHEPGK
jgi:hypothetical protein